MADKEQEKSLEKTHHALGLHPLKGEFFLTGPSKIPKNFPGFIF